ncbi:gp136 [Sphingomonas phage PAU]|uniref:gp136 n=1 Tax=Sphingomonas phage PAU TaxID=1150991 RepID=UPI000257327B|nr:gp136 [Sphingomonas phage PAU]AFF28134.1 gp136 [Sphingomonas phage PAU]
MSTIYQTILTVSEKFNSKSFTLETISELLLDHNPSTIQTILSHLVRVSALMNEANSYIVENEIVLNSYLENTEKLVYDSTYITNEGHKFVMTEEIRKDLNWLKECIENDSFSGIKQTTSGAGKSIKLIFELVKQKNETNVFHIWYRYRSNNGCSQRKTNAYKYRYSLHNVIPEIKDIFTN